MTERSEANRQGFSFAMSPELGVWTTKRVMSGEDPLLLVAHARNGDWQFLHGAVLDLDDGVVVHVAHVTKRHPELHELADLPRGWAAERSSVSEEWKRFELPEEVG